MDAPLALNRQQSRQIDAVAIERYGFPSIVLMENAGRGVVDVLLSIDAGLRGTTDRKVVILCGKGNNAGDGFVVARHLAIREVPSKVVLLCPAAELRGDAQLNYTILTHCDVPIVDLSEAAQLTDALDAESADAAWLVDAMLGTGAQGEPRGAFPTAIDWMNRQSAQRLAIDVPSGLDCDTGLFSNATVHADHTCTFVTAKVGFTAAAARDYVGQLHVVSIGIPQKLIREVAGT